MWDILIHINVLNPASQHSSLSRNSVHYEPLNLKNASVEFLLVSYKCLCTVPFGGYEHSADDRSTGLSIQLDLEKKSILD